MSKLPLITAKDMATVLESIGFRFIRQKGSHAFYAHSDGRVTLIPFHKGEDLHRGLIRSILRNAELSIEGYLALRKKI